MGHERFGGTSPANKLREVFGAARVSTEAEDLDASSKDSWPRRLLEEHSTEPERPLAVVWPERTEDVARLVELARDEGFSLAPLGAGSGVCGGFWPDPRTVVVDLKRLRNFAVSPDGSEVRAGAGLLGVELEERLFQLGKTAGHFPSSILCSSVGGWVAARGAGPCSGRYGKIEDMVTSLTTVLGTGQALEARARQHGPSLVPLLVGSEGTLGIFTEVGLRLHAAPVERAFSSFAFPTFEAGQNALRELYQSGLRPAVARLYDPVDSLLHAPAEDDDELLRELTARTAGAEATLGTRSVAHGGGASFLRRSIESVLLRGVLRAPGQLLKLVDLLEKRGRARAVLLLVFENVSDLAGSARAAEQVCLEQGGHPLGEAPARHWFLHRYDVSFRQSRVFRSGAFSDTMEVSAPWSKLDGVYRAVRSAISRRVLLMAHISHSYPDGAAIYFTFVGRGDTPAEALSLYDSVWRDALRAAVLAGAAASHHHGVGRSKTMALALGSKSAVQARLASALDPARILNPGVLDLSTADLRSADDEPRKSERRSRPLWSLDRVSQLADFDARLTLDEASNLAFKSGLEFPHGHGAHGALSLDRWIAAGLPGTESRWDDPVTQPFAGYEATLASGIELSERAAPRRAEGSDLSALFVGMQGRVGRVDRVTLVLRRVGVSTDACAGPVPEEHPPSADERAVFERLTDS